MPLTPFSTTNAVGSLRLSSNVEVAKELLQLRGSRIVDVGCGDGKFTFLLAAEGADMTGMDINDAALTKAHARQNDHRVTFLNACAENMPLSSGALDVVVFSNSFHHVEPESMAAALSESARVLKAGGHLYVMEPVAAGHYFEATRLVNDERTVRATAYGAIESAASFNFAPVVEVFYRTQRRFSSFAEYREEQILTRSKRKRCSTKRVRKSGSASRVMQSEMAPASYLIKSSG